MMMANKTLSHSSVFVRVNHNLAQRDSTSSIGLPKAAFTGLSNSRQTFEASQQKKQTTYMRQREKKSRKEIAALIMKSKVRGAQPTVLKYDAAGIAKQERQPASAACLVDCRPLDNGGVQYDKTMKSVREYKQQHSQLKGDAVINSNLQVNLKLSKILRETAGLAGESKKAEEPSDVGQWLE